MSSISIADMQNFAENMDGSSDIKISSNIGNVIELGDDDLGDNFGADLFTNSRVSSSSRPAVSIQPISTLEKVDDIGISSLEPLESISFDLSDGKNNNLPDVFVNKEQSYSNGYSNDQSASGPSINLAAATRLSAEEERKKKIDLINKLNRLESKGYNLTKRFTMDNALDEIQVEYDRLVDAKNLEASLRFQRQCMMGVVTGAEFMNSKFNPFDWELDGWSESVHENIEDFDEVFEELYDKYKGRGNMPPEAKLLMSLVGSGFMFHMSNSFFRSKMANTDPSDIFRANPQLAKQFAQAAAQQAGPGFGNFMGAAMGMPQQQAPMPPQMPSQMPSQMNMGTPGPFYQASNAQMPPQFPQNMAAMTPPNAPRREMSGPKGMDDIMKTFQEVRAADMDPMPPVFSSTMSFSNQPAMQAAAEISSVHSGDISDVESVRTTATSGQRAGRGRRKPTIPAGNTMTLNL
jgi:Family of unknown function (DUF5767)